MPTRHVVLVTYGEPPAAEFRAQLVYSWRILLGLTRTVAPIPRLLLPLIALARARGRVRAWREEGYRSPLESITVAQAAALRRALAARSGDVPWKVHVTYEFRRPLLDELLSSLPAGDQADVVPLYAADSAFTHGLSRAVVEAARASGAGPSARVLPALEAEPLARASADHVLQHLQGRPDMTGPDVALVLAAHGTLLEPPKPIDTGLEATERLCGELRERLAPAFGMAIGGWLNHARGGRWTEPPIDEALRAVVDRGFARVVYFPYGFLADNAESELEGRVALRLQPGLQALHLPCLNESPLLSEVLVDQILQPPRA